MALPVFNADLVPSYPTECVLETSTAKAPNRIVNNALLDFHLAAGLVLIIPVTVKLEVLVASALLATLDLLLMDTAALPTL